MAHDYTWNHYRDSYKDEATALGMKALDYALECGEFALAQDFRKEEQYEMLELQEMHDAIPAMDAHEINIANEQGEYYNYDFIQEYFDHNGDYPCW